MIWASRRCWMDGASQPVWLSAANNLAWLLATHKDAQFRNGAEALRLAESVCRMTHHGTAAFLDSLAAACAEAGRFREAEVWAQKAIDLAEASNQDALANEIRGRLELYQVGLPYRESPVATGKGER